jgi:hypothetical protein
MTAANDETRPTPYDLIFGAPAFDEARFDLIMEQARDSGAATPTELFMLPAAGTLMRELLPEDTGSDVHRALVAQLSALLFHAVQFVRYGKRVYTVSEAAARGLVERETVGEWTFAVPVQAGYVQLPRNLFWARVEEDGAPEPVDGFFWSAPADGPSAGRLDILCALGVRRNRPGLSLVDAAVEQGTGAAQWLDVDARPGDTDFANVMPGGELQGYHSLTTTAEVLKLAVRCLWYIDTDAVSSG